MLRAREDREERPRELGALGLGDEHAAVARVHQEEHAAARLDASHAANLASQRRRPLLHPGPVGMGPGPVAFAKFPVSITPQG